MERVTKKQPLKLFILKAFQGPEPENDGTSPLERGERWADIGYVWAIDLENAVTKFDRKLISRGYELSNHEFAGLKTARALERFDGEPQLVLVELPLTDSATLLQSRLQLLKNYGYFN